MAINADKSPLWRADTRASVDQFNQWFLKFAPQAYHAAAVAFDAASVGEAISVEVQSIGPIRYQIVDRVRAGRRG
jgi:hypothetical protein